MSARPQKAFISTREFVESWDKELYELTNLDYFIFLMINHLGNQLHKNFFNINRRDLENYLDFDSICTLSFNLGDAFGYFLEDNCFDSCPINCPRDLDGKIDICSVKLEDRIKRKLDLLQSFLLGQLEKEHCLRIDLMNHVIISTMQQFYLEELNIEFEEDDISFLEMAEFIEGVIIEFMKFEGKTLIDRPFESALEHFEDLLQKESELKSDDLFKPETNEWQFEPEKDNWNTSPQTVDDVIMHFLNDRHYNPKFSADPISHDIEYLNKYLKEKAKITNISDFTQMHLAEFLGVWLVHEFVLTDALQIPHIFRATARFVTFLYHHYDINLKKDFLTLYDALKIDLPRVIQATNSYISEYNMLDSLLILPKDQDNILLGYFEVLETKQRTNQSIKVRNLSEFGKEFLLKIESGIIFKLQQGDVIHASIIKRESGWELLEIQYIYPNIALNFVY